MDPRGIPARWADLGDLGEVSARIMGEPEKYDDQNGWILMEPGKSETTNRCNFEKNAENTPANPSLGTAAPCSAPRQKVSGPF